MNKHTQMAKWMALLLITLIINISLLSAQTASLTRAERMDQIRQEISTLKQKLSPEFKNGGEFTDRDTWIMNRLGALEDHLALLQTTEGAQLMEQRSIIERMTGFSYDNDGKSIAQALRVTPDDGSKAYELLKLQAAFESSFMKMTDSGKGEQSRHILQLHRAVTKAGQTLPHSMVIPNDSNRPPMVISTGNPETDDENHRIAKDRWIHENESTYKQMLEKNNQ